MWSDATAIILYAKIRRLDLLHRVYEDVRVPTAVRDEVIVEGKPGVDRIQNALHDWLHVEQVDDAVEGLGPGEAAVVAAARATGEHALLDDAVAITEARRHGVDVDRSTTVAFGAVRNGILSRDEAMECIDALIDAGYYISADIYKELWKALQG